MRRVIIVLVLLAIGGCKTATHKCDAYESKPIVKKKR
jgi:hypothetical protein